VALNRKTKINMDGTSWPGHTMEKKRTSHEGPLKRHGRAAPRKGNVPGNPHMTKPRALVTPGMKSFMGGM